MSRNDLKEIEKLYAIEKTYLIPKVPKEGQQQVKIVVKPFDLEQISSIEFPADNAPLSEVAKFAKKFFSISLDIPEDKCNFSVEYMQDILSSITDANGMTNEDMKKTGVNKIQDFLAKKRELIAKQQGDNGNQPADREPEKSGPA